jgi:hypothetical protein
MTLCIAWKRQTRSGQELIFATDSCLSGGERWENGVKLFELPRKDCLICFSGTTSRTYPLILNLINSLRFDKHAVNPNFDINDLVFYIATLFTDLLKQVKGKTFDDVMQEDQFDFLFGGWSWRENNFKLWKIEYVSDMRSFQPITDYDNLMYSMIGDNLEEAKEKLMQEYVRSGNMMKGYLDTEPLKVLVAIIRDSEFSYISGAVQFAKIYPPGVTEFFGVYHPSVMNGKKTFLGRDVSQNNNPSVRFIDPDTGSIIETEIPSNLIGLDSSIFGNDEPFIRECYPENILKQNLTEKDKEMIKNLFKEVAFKKLISEMEDVANNEQINLEENE